MNDTTLDIYEDEVTILDDDQVIEEQVADTPESSDEWGTIESFDDIEDLDDLPIKEIAVKAWGKKVWIQSLDATQARWFQHHSVKAMKIIDGVPVPNDLILLGKMETQLCAWGIVNPDTRQPIVPKNKVKQLAKRNPEAISFIADKIIRFSNLIPEKPIAAAEGNLDEIPIEETELT